MNAAPFRSQQYYEGKKEKEIMPKRVFWPTALVIMGLIFMASNMGYLPARFWNLWPVILVVVGLGGLLTSDRDEWIKKPTSAKRRPAARKKSRRR